MYAGAIAGVEFMQWQQHGLSPYLAIATGLLVIYSLLVDYKGQVRWDRIQLILLAGLIFTLCSKFCSKRICSMALAKCFKSGHFCAGGSASQSDATSSQIF
ncbi:Uncharacterised protein [Acinetobacter haemolyticus]|nr:Uncharacterised protein [Acinetobacter haemolyticus]